MALWIYSIEKIKRLASHTSEWNMSFLKGQFGTGVNPCEFGIIFSWKLEDNYYVIKYNK